MPYPVPLNQKIFDNDEFLAFYVSNQHVAAKITYLSTWPATSISMNNYYSSNAWNDPSISESRSLLKTVGKKNLNHLLTPLRGNYQNTLQNREEHQTFRTELISTFTYKNYSNMMAPLMRVTSGTCFMVTVKNSLWFSYRSWKPEKSIKHLAGEKRKVRPNAFALRHLRTFIKHYIFHVQSLSCFWNIWRLILR